MPNATEKPRKIKNKYYPLDLVMSESLVTLVRAVLGKFGGWMPDLSGLKHDSDPVFIGLLILILSFYTLCLPFETLSPCLDSQT